MNKSNNRYDTKRKNVLWVELNDYEKELLDLKVKKSGEIGEGEEENNRIYVFLEKSNKNISVFLDVKYGLCQKVRKIAPK